MPKTQPRHRAGGASGGASGGAEEEDAMMDWIDKEREDRQRGITRSLLPSQHDAVNARYPGTMLEYCCECDAPTGRAGRADD